MTPVRNRFWSGPPLALQIVGLLLAGLVVAQAVTLLLTLVFPPAPPPQYALEDVGRALTGGSLETRSGRPLLRMVQATPPNPSGSAWWVSEQPRRDLAKLLNKPLSEVALYFYTPLPIESAGGFPLRQPRPSQDPASLPPGSAGEAAAPFAPHGLFGLAPGPLVFGEFIAALKLDDGRWAVVEPEAAPFPNSWQRRVLLWFVISFAIVAPLGWIFARNLARPITGFAMAAEKLGRDTRAPVLAVEGPAEVGRAAIAFNKMQSRLRSFVADRTAFVGAISHDLRTPLTRLRFRIEDLPEEQRTGMLAEVEEMEQMISSVLSFIRDASEPGSRERLDLSTLIEDVVEDAVFVGKRVTLEQTQTAPVEIDALGMRRVLNNLVDNATKFGDEAKIRLFTDHQDAVTEIIDNGPGLPEEELERVFQAFYRAGSSSKRGFGLGLAVCRSIARAHGGDVRLIARKHGLVAQLRVPLAFGASV